MLKKNKVFPIVSQYSAETQEKTVSPSTSEIEVMPDSGYLLNKVTVEAVTSSIDANIQAENIKKDITILGVTGNFTNVNKVPMILDGSSVSLNADDMEGCKAIRQYLFYQNSGLTSIYIPSTVTSIGGNAFNTASALTTVTIEHSDNPSMTSIGAYAFSACSNLTGSIKIPNSVKTLGNGAFNACKKLTSITLGNKLTNTGNSTFSGCTGLSSVYFTGTLEEWCATPFNTETSNPLRYGKNLYINNQLVTTASISDGVTAIGAYVFRGCTSVTSIIIPSSVVSIGVQAFDGCTNLTSVTINASNPPNLSNSNAFANTNNCPIYVPDGSLERYKGETNWANLASRIQAIP